MWHPVASGFCCKLRHCRCQIYTHLRHGKPHHSPSFRRSRQQTEQASQDRFWAMSSHVDMRRDYIRTSYTWTLSIDIHQHSSFWRHIHAWPCRQHLMSSGCRILHCRCQIDTHLRHDRLHHSPSLSHSSQQTQEEGRCKLLAVYSPVRM